MIKHCRDCGAYSYYPRPVLPRVLERATWSGTRPAGEATLYTWSVIYNNDQPPFRDRVPYVAAIVDLEEGPRMMTNVVDTPFEDLAVGMALTVTFMRSATTTRSRSSFRPEPDHRRQVAARRTWATQ